MNSNSPNGNGPNTNAAGLNVDWPVSTAPARFIMGIDSNQPKAGLTFVHLNLPDPKWLNMPVRFFTDKGVAVASELFWSSPNEQAIYLFDSSSGASIYRAYFGSNWPPLPLKDSRAGVWLETRRGPGAVVQNLDEMLKAWNRSDEVLGRAIVPGIFEGGNRFGPQGNLLLHFQGFFDVPTQEKLQFGIISSDSTFVLVDGKEVVEAPGLHGWQDELANPAQGEIDLSPGPHTLDYYNSYVPSPQGGPVVLACLAVKGGPFANWTMLNGAPNFFRPVAGTHAYRYELQSGAPSSSPLQAAPGIAIDDFVKGESLISSDVDNVGLIEMDFFVLQNSLQYDKVTWTFDDGGSASGPNVIHLFARPGPRQIRVGFIKDGVEITSMQETVAVHAEWAPPLKDPGRNPNYEDEITSRDLSAMSGPDLSSCAAIFGYYGALDPLRKVVPFLSAKMKDVPEVDLPYLKDVVAFLGREDWSHDAEQMALLQALLDRASAVSPATPAVDSVIANCRLALVRLTLRTTDHLDDVTRLIGGVNRSALDPNGPRLLDILKADLALAQGDVAGARSAYTALTSAPTGPDERSSIRRTARIEQARAYIQTGDFDAAEDALNEVAWASPIDKLAPDWALTRLRLFQEEGLSDVAYLYARRLLPVIADEGRTDLLFRLTDLALAHNDHDLAAKTLSELLEKHPYSEEAALAKQKWPATP